MARNLPAGEHRLRVNVLIGSATPGAEPGILPEGGRWHSNENVQAASEQIQAGHAGVSFQ